MFYIVVGVIAVGGKLGSLLFYQTGQLLSEPDRHAEPVRFRAGWRGMSFHGGFVGVLVAFWLYGRNTGRTFFQVSDFFTPAFPIGLGAGPHRQLHQRRAVRTRHRRAVGHDEAFPASRTRCAIPNQLYQFFFEGVVLFALIWWFSSKPRPRMTVSGLFVLAYGVYRFFIEFVRQPDAHLGFVAMDWLTMGQLLSFPMILAGAAMMIIGFRRGTYDGGEAPPAGNGAASGTSRTPAMAGAGVAPTAAPSAGVAASADGTDGEPSVTSAGSSGAPPPSRTAPTSPGRKKGGGKSGRGKGAKGGRGKRGG